MRKFLITVIACIGALLFAVRIVSADAQMSTTNTSPITIDGDYDDWSGAKKTSSITGYTSSVVTNGKYIYMHINTTSQWYIPSTGYLVKVGNALYRLTFDDLQQKQVNGQTTAFSVSAATEGWQSLGTVGDGEITYNSKWDASQNANVISLQLECRVAVSALGADDTISQPVSVANSSVNTQEIQAQDSDFITSTDKATDGSNKNTETGSTDDNSALSSSNLDSASSTSSSTSDPVKQAITGSDKTTTDSGLAENNNVNGNLNIKIDGNFDDWKDITKSDMKINGDDDNIKPAALVANDKNVYFYVSMEPKLAGGYSTFQGSGYELNVGGHTYYVTLDDNDHHDLSLAVGETKLVDVGIYSKENGNKTVTNGCAVTRRNLTQKNGDGSDYAGTSYVWEVAIPFKDLGNISNTADQDITLSDSNLWSGKLTSTSGSTGPVVLAGIGFLFALVSVLKFSGIDKKILKNKNSESI